MVDDRRGGEVFTELFKRLGVGGRDSLAVRVPLVLDGKAKEVVEEDAELLWTAPVDIPAVALAEDEVKLLLKAVHRAVAVPGWRGSDGDAGLHEGLLVYKNPGHVHVEDRALEGLASLVDAGRDLA